MSDCLHTKKYAPVGNNGERIWAFCVTKALTYNPSGFYHKDNFQGHTK